MRRIFLVTTLVAMFSTLSGCTPLAFAGAAVVFQLSVQHIEKQEHARHIEKQKRERLCREVEKKARLQREQLASRRAEERRRRQHEEQVRREAEERARLQREQLAIRRAEERRRREEQARRFARRQQAKRNRAQLALLPDEAKRQAAKTGSIQIQSSI